MCRKDKEKAGLCLIAYFSMLVAFCIWLRSVSFVPVLIMDGALIQAVIFPHRKLNLQPVQKAAMAAIETFPRLLSRIRRKRKKNTTTSKPPKRKERDPQ